MRAAFEGASDAVRTLIETFDTDTDVSVAESDPTDQEAGEETGEDGAGLRAELADARARVEDLEAENERLRERDPEPVGLEPLETYEEFLETEAVQTEIAAAKEEASTAPRYVKGHAF